MYDAITIAQEPWYWVTIISFMRLHNFHNLWLEVIVKSVDIPSFAAFVLPPLVTIPIPLLYPQREKSLVLYSCLALLLRQKVGASTFVFVLPHIPLLLAFERGPIWQRQSVSIVCSVWLSLQYQQLYSCLVLLRLRPRWISLVRIRHRYQVDDWQSIMIIWRLKY